MKRLIISILCIAIFSFSLVTLGQGVRTGKLFPVVANGKGGYINITGQIIVEPRFDLAMDFYEGFAHVRLGSKWGYINESGQMVIEPKFQ